MPTGRRSSARATPARRITTAAAGAASGRRGRPPGTRRPWRRCASTATATRCSTSCARPGPPATRAPPLASEPTGGTLVRLAGTIAHRARERPDGSYTARLLGEGVARVAQKLGEEAVETVVAATAEDGARLASEAADLLYHLLVLLEARRLPLDQVLQERDARAGAR